MIGLVYDTETTGLPLYSQPSGDPAQPHLVQLACCLCDSSTKGVIAALDVLIRPDGWLIPPSVTQVHGITTEKAVKYGVPERLAVEMFLALHAAAEVRIGHNEPFDARMMRIALKRYGIGDPDAFKASPAECTQKMATPIITAHGRDAGVKGKTAKLSEAYQFFVGRELVGGHRAMVDVHATMQVYFAIKGMQP
jgi:DNA polymerase-3 subunit epsilon